MSNRVIQLFVDGQGMSEVEVRPGQTLQDIAAAYDLNGYTVTVDGDSVPAINWSSYVLDASQGVWATRGQKGAC